MTIIEKKMNALKALEQLDTELNDGLTEILTACKSYLDKYEPNKTKSENAIIKQYRKRVEKVVASLSKGDNE